MNLNIEKINIAFSDFLNYVKELENKYIVKESENVELNKKNKVLEEKIKEINEKLDRINTDFYELSLENKKIKENSEKVKNQSKLINSLINFNEKILFIAIEKSWDENINEVNKSDIIDQNLRQQLEEKNNEIKELKINKLELEKELSKYTCKEKIFDNILEKISKYSDIRNFSADEWNNILEFAKKNSSITNLENLDIKEMIERLTNNIYITDTLFTYMEGILEKIKKKGLEIELLTLEEISELFLWGKKHEIIDSKKIDRIESFINFAKKNGSFTEEHLILIYNDFFEIIKKIKANKQVDNKLNSNIEKIVSVNKIKKSIIAQESLTKVEINYQTYIKEIKLMVDELKIIDDKINIKIVERLFHYIEALENVPENLYKNFKDLEKLFKINSIVIRNDFLLLKIYNNETDIYIKTLKENLNSLVKNLGETYIKLENFPKFKLSDAEVVLFDRVKRINRSQWKKIVDWARENNKLQKNDYNILMPLVNGRPVDELIGSDLIDLLELYIHFEKEGLEVNKINSAITENEISSKPYTSVKNKNIEKKNSQINEIYKLEDIEKIAIAFILERKVNNKVEIASLLGIGRTTLYEKIWKYGLDKGLNSYRESKKMDMLIEQIQKMIRTQNYELEKIEKTAIEYVLEKTRNNKMETANLLGIGRTTLYEKIRKYKL